MADKNRCGCRCNTTTPVGDNFICIHDMDTRVISNTRISGTLPWDKNGDAGFTGIYDWLSLKTCIGGTFCTKETGNLLGSYVGSVNANATGISSALTNCSFSTYWTSSGPYFDSNQNSTPIDGSDITISENGDFYACKEFNITNTGSAAVTGGTYCSGVFYVVDVFLNCDDCVTQPTVQDSNFAGSRVIVQSELCPSTTELTGTNSNVFKIFDSAPLDSGLYSWTGIGTGITPTGFPPSL